MKTMLKRDTGESGFTLLELVVGLGLISVFLLGTGSYFNYASQDRNRERDASARDTVLFSAANSAIMPSALRNSYLHGQQALPTDPSAVNIKLAKCVEANAEFPGPPIPSEIDCDGDPAHYYDIVLFDPQFDRNNMMSSGEIAGTTAAPLYKDAEGYTCVPAPGTYCPIQITSKFRAQCPPAVAGGAPLMSCDVADLIEVTVTIEPNVVPPPPGTSLVNFKKIVNTFVVPVRDISGATPDPTPLTLASPAPGWTPPPTPPHPPHYPVHCPAPTIAYGPFFCACPPGQTLTNLSPPVCQNIS